MQPADQATCRQPARMPADQATGLQQTCMPAERVTRLFAHDAKFSAECDRWGFGNVAFWEKSGIRLEAAARLGLFFVAAQGMLSHSSRKMASNGKSLVASR